MTRAIVPRPGRRGSIGSTSTGSTGSVVSGGSVGSGGANASGGPNGSAGANAGSDAGSVGRPSSITDRLYVRPTREDACPQPKPLPS